MRDASEALIPAGSEPITMDQHRGFMSDMAAMHAAYWGFRDDPGLCPLCRTHYVIPTPKRWPSSRRPRLVEIPCLPRSRPDGGGSTSAIPADARRLRKLARRARGRWSSRCSAGPQTFIHGDWKLGNLGRDGARTILLDWDRTGEAPPLVDLAWYLAVNCDRLPGVQGGHHRRVPGGPRRSAGIPTPGSWWDEQLAAALAGAFLQLAWSKTEDATEFGWWSERLAAWNP